MPAQLERLLRLDIHGVQTMRQLPRDAPILESIEGLGLDSRRTHGLRQVSLNADIGELARWPVDQTVAAVERVALQEPLMRCRPPAVEAESHLTASPAVLGGNSRRELLGIPGGEFPVRAPG